MITPQLFEELKLRRQKFFDHLNDDSIAILFNASIVARNGDTEYPFRPSSDFYYLTGFEEPDAIAVFIPKRAEGEYILFSLPKDPEQERWTGKRIGQEEACTLYGAKQAFPLHEFENALVKLSLDKKNLFYVFDDPIAENKIRALFNVMSKHSCKNNFMPQRFENVSPIIRELRLFKSNYEITLMRQAAQISVMAHQKAMQVCQPGLFEYQLEAELEYTFTQQGAKFEAYPSIVAGGSNACILHYNHNMAELKNGDLVLIDAGCEYEFYASDVTRTFPVNGKFSEPQKKIYDIVLAAQLATIAEIKPGNSWGNLQSTTAHVITKGLIELGLLKGDINALLEKKAYQRFYMHRFGHWIGLDTHDPSDYKQGGNWRLLEPGMVLTVEPGIYIAPPYDDIDPIWRDIGIRIEDDVLVTVDGSDVLSKGLAKSIDEIEDLMRKA